jgi:hypothetical protein
MARKTSARSREEKEGYMGNETKIEKSEKIEKFPDIWTPTLAVIHSQTDALKACRNALIYGVQLKAANIENIISARENIKVVDESILFRSLGGES